MEKEEGRRRKTVTTTLLHFSCILYLAWQLRVRKKYGQISLKAYTLTPGPGEK